MDDVGSGVVGGLPWAFEGDGRLEVVSVERAETDDAGLVTYQLEIDAAGEGRAVVLGEDLREGMMQEGIICKDRVQAPVPGAGARATITAMAKACQALFPLADQIMI